METFIQPVSKRLRNASNKARVLPGEPSPKRTRFGRRSDSPISLHTKNALHRSSEENLSPLVAKSFYGTNKSQPVINERDKSCTKQSSDISEPVKQFGNGNSKATCPVSRLDELMLEKIALSPVKQAVLRTCSMNEFRKMYRDEYKKLEEEVKRQNCRMTRQMSLIINKEKEEQSVNSDSSDDDEVNWKLPKSKDIQITTGHQISPEKVTEFVTDHKSKSLNETDITPPRRNQLKMNNILLKNIAIDEKLPVEKCTTQEKNVKHDVPMDTNIPKVQQSVDQSYHFKENSQITNMSKDLSQKLTSPSSGRRFFKTRSPVDSSRRGSIIWNKGFNLKFKPQTLKVDSKKNKLDWQKRQPESLSSKIKQPVVTSLQCAEKSVEKEHVQCESGFTFAPGFLSPEKLRSDNLEGEESLNLNKSNCCTYGSASPKYMTAEVNSSNGSSPKFSSENSSYLTDDCEADVTVRDNGADDDKSSSINSNTSTAEKDSYLSIPSHKFFPIFVRKSGTFAVSDKKQSSDTSPVSSSSKLPKDSSNSQMIIDAGQKKIGVTHCSECGMVYCQPDPVDKATHAKFHKQLIEVLKFPGWKKERVVQEYPEDLGRVILVLPDDAKYARRKVEEVNQLMGRELGFADTSSPLHPYHKVFFYVEDKQITGCCVAESVQEGYRIIPGDLDNSQESGQRPWCCAPIPESVCVGISRLWVTASKRKRGVSTKLVDCVRQWYTYGSLIPKHKVAFSDPTPDGRRFAQKYMGTPTFLVYKFSYG